MSATTSPIHYSYQAIGQLLLVNVGELNVAHIIGSPAEGGYQLWLAGDDEPAGGGERLPSLAACESVIDKAALLRLKAKLGA